MLATAALALSMFVTPARAAGIADSDLGKGITRLIQDATAFVGIAGCAIAILAAMGFFAIRALADEQDAKMWNIWPERVSRGSSCPYLRRWIRWE